MPKTRTVNVTLITVGSLLFDLHYGPYSRFWWQHSSDSTKDNLSYFPIRVGQTTKAILNEKVFYLTIVVENSDNSFAPGFICTSGTISSKNNGSSGYKSSLNYKYHDKSALFVSTIEGNHCILKIHQNSQVQCQFVDNSPNAVWKSSNFIKNFEGINLFGFQNSQTKESIYKNMIPTCLPTN
ncbi:13880_t:CDS:2 [Ambispora leptoticha]|uniref:13880_t:CDS:1 n=1 Tax=Ambispora leptoticha TaxID=144679 RepID=A0A9N8ZSS9_9GLOM|nr:13880_t:CDS:2 [Ambispora leptoticha]